MAHGEGFILTGELDGVFFNLLALDRATVFLFLVTGEDEFFLVAVARFLVCFGLFVEEISIEVVFKQGLGREICKRALRRGAMVIIFEVDYAYK